MKPLVCIYCEGNDTKIAVIEKDKDEIRVVRTASFDFVQNTMDIEDGLSSINIDGDDLGITTQTSTQNLSVSSASISGVTMVNSTLKDLNLSKYSFIPALTEPVVYFHVYEGNKEKKSNKLTEEIITDIQVNQHVNVDKDSIGYLEMADGSLLSVVLNEDVPCLKLINSLARANGKRYYKIPTVKNAEVSLAYYVAKKKKFFPDDSSLIVYIGKEYSKLVFLQGRKLKHIGSTLDIGTINLHTYDVYFSKILLEMENGGINQLDNIVVCGEDDSENLILSFYGTFPEANVSRLDFDELILDDLDNRSKEILSSFTVPIAIATEYYEELEGTYKGLNLLPKWVKEDQKFIQFAWHGYAMLPLLFAAAFFITLQVLKNDKQIGELNQEIATKSELLRENQEIVNKINDLDAKIDNFGQTKIMLDSAQAGTEIYCRLLKDVSNFIGGRKNIWVTKLSSDNGDNALIEGYAKNRKVLTELASSFKNAELKSIKSEDLKAATAYQFDIVINLSQYRDK